MAVELATLVPSLKREVSPPGTDLYPSIDDAAWEAHLTDAFWEARLNGALSGYTEVDGAIVPQTPAKPDMPRELQQLIVLFAGYRIALTAFQNINTKFRTKAGPVEYEVEKSATTLKTLLEALRDRMKGVLAAIGIDENGVSKTSAIVFDRVMQLGMGYR